MYMPIQIGKSIFSLKDLPLTAMGKNKQQHSSKGGLVVKMKTGYLKLNASSLIRYFTNVLKEKTGVSHRSDSSDYALQGSALKRKVIDTFVLNGWTVDDMTEFVHWVFDNKPREKWSINMLSYFINDWVLVRKDEKKAETETDRSEEGQFLLYLGEGYFDSDLTKLQYWTGLMWRWKNRSPIELEKVRVRQEKLYSPDTIHRLREWETELRTVKFDPLRQFYFELAANREKTVIETLKEFGRENYRSLFTDDELEIIPMHAPVDGSKDL